MTQEKNSRKHAIDQGRQKDVSDVAKESGLPFTVFITGTLWDSWVIPDQQSRDSGQNEKQRLSYIISKLVYAIRVHRRTSKSDTIYFDVSFTKNGETERVLLVSKLAAIDLDDPRPCITIMMPEEG